MTEQKSNNSIAFAIIATLFFIFGFVTWLNGVLIPYLKLACELNNFESYFVAFAFYISYFVMAIPSAWVLQKTGFKNGMSLGLLVMSIGAALFIPAAIQREYGLFLLALFIVGTGLSLLQTASNPYVTIIGPIESAAKRISIMGICNKIAGVLSPIILGAVVLKDADVLMGRIQSLAAEQRATELNLLAQRVIEPYAIMSLVLLALASFVYFMKLPEIEQSESSANSASEHSSIWQHKNLIYGVLALFLYVGAEVIAGDSIISYGMSKGIALDQAKNFTSYTLIAMVVGYVLGILLIPKYLRQEKALYYSGLLGMVLALAAIFGPAYFSVLCIALLGLANSLVWPAIWPMAIQGLGKYTKLGSSLLIMAIAGGALLPLLYGQLADLLNPQQAYWILIPIYLIITWYARKFDPKSA